jgi:S-adenosylmethionine:tRNA ribosyltransferase-isomerase
VADGPGAGRSTTAGFTADDVAYDCPVELIAQYPAPQRDDSRLLVLDHATGAIAHRTFRDFPALLRPGDVLVLNTSRVIPARLLGRRDNGAPAEILLVHPVADGTWLAMVHPGGKLKVGRKVWFGDAGEAGAAGGVGDASAGPPVRRSAAGTALSAEIVEVVGGGLRRIRFHGADAATVMERYGAVPLPPYIRRPAEPADGDRYQTVYATVDGSVAAPTAGLHFTPEILAAIRTRGVAVAEIVLHVGPGTFKPVDVADPSRHVMHAEWYQVPPEAAATINAARRAGGAVWAVGTTAARTLETAASSDAPRAGVSAGSGWTDLFIYPPYAFRVVDRLLTNFHLPRSTLLMLVAAFAGHGSTMAAYREAVRERYRLYSYGDAMAIL